ncbi:MAG TPA: transcriptional regulator [Blastocatellia bacterium]|nr:transcriptional regulator [Blastocatellia bacterium]
MAEKADEKAAKENRLRVFRAEGAQALEDAANEAIAIRKNMARLRELRLAREAATIREQIAAGNDTKAKPKKRSR